MSGVVDSIPEQHRDSFLRVLADRDPALLEALRAQERPTSEQADTVSDIFMRAFVANLDEDDAPTALGLRIDEALGAFLTRWPREVLEEQG